MENDPKLNEQEDQILEMLDEQIEPEPEPEPSPTQEIETQGTEEQGDGDNVKEDKSAEVEQEESKDDAEEIKAEDNKDEEESTEEVQEEKKAKPDKEVSKMSKNIKTTADESIDNAAKNLTVNPLEIGVDETLLSGTKLKNYTAKDLKAMDRSLSGATAGTKEADKLINVAVEKGKQVAIRLNLNSKMPSAPENIKNKMQTIHSKTARGKALSAYSNCRECSFFC